MKTLNFKEMTSVSGGVTLDEFRNGVRVSTPIAGAIVGLCFTHIFDLNKTSSRIIAMMIGGAVFHIVTEINIGDEAWVKGQQLK